jgi:hypothetical protein
MMGVTGVDWACFGAERSEVVPGVEVAAAPLIGLDDCASESDLPVCCAMTLEMCMQSSASTIKGAQANFAFICASVCPRALGNRTALAAALMRINSASGGD